jgi:very-short-patch-repair endonuclease
MRGMNVTSKARQLRKQSTDAENALWYHLRNRQFIGYKFRRQQPLGDYIVDFICLEKHLIIEVDGSQHQEQIHYDKERTKWLESQGFSVLRFWNNDVLSQMGAVQEAIWQALQEYPHPSTYSPKIRSPKIFKLRSRTGQALNPLPSRERK